MAAKKKTMEERARKVACSMCDCDLTAKPTRVESTLRGRPVVREALRAPARANVSIQFSGADTDKLPYLSFWLCGSCLALAAEPTRDQLTVIVGGRLASIGTKATP